MFKIQLTTWFQLGCNSFGKAVRFQQVPECTKQDYNNIKKSSESSELIYLGFFLQLQWNILSIWVFKD